MNTNINKSNESLPLWRKIGYGVGDAGANFCWTLIGSFIMIYCTNTLGISASVIGTLMMVSKLLDGFTDVIMGRIIDMTHNKMGKARFWYFVSILPVAVLTFFIFNVPASFTENTKYVYIFIMYTLIGAIFYTMNNIAYSSLTALCTKNPEDRVQMGSFRFVFSLIAVIGMSSVTMNLVEVFGGGQHGWTTVALIYSILCAVFLLVPFFCVKELPQDQHDPTKGKEEKKESLGFGKSVSLLFHNKYFILILILYLVYYLTTGIQNSIGVYFARYNLGNDSAFGVLTMASMVPLVILLPFVSVITKRFGMQKSTLYGRAIGLVGNIITVAGGLNGNFTLVLVGLVIFSIGLTPQTGALNALIAEADEYSHLKYGHYNTGMIFSCSSVGIKIGSGLGTAIIGFMLDLSGFNGTIEVQTATALSTIQWGYLLPGIISSVVGLIIFAMMDVEKKNAELHIHTKQFEK